MKRLRIIGVLLLIMSGGLAANAAEERYSGRFEGAQIQQGSILKTIDDKYFEMSVYPFWQAHFTNYRVSNKITLGLKKK